MDRAATYTSGRATRRMNLDGLIDSIADQVVHDGNVERALQRAFRFGTEDDIGLLDVLDRLKQEIEHHQEIANLDQHSTDQIPVPSAQRIDDAVAMRESLRQVESLDDLHGLDPELMQRTLSHEELEWVERWANATGQMIESGLVVMSGARLTLTARAIRQLGARLLHHLFLPPTLRGRGEHVLHRRGTQGTSGDSSSPWEWGRPMDLDIPGSLSNAVREIGARGDLRLAAEDFEVIDRESGAAISTVLLTDMSRSMFDSGAWDAAKRAAIALDTLISTSRVHDTLSLVGFSGDARELTLEELPSLTWDQFSYGTNLHAGLLAAGRFLSRFRGTNRQVVIITDGEPTAHMHNGYPVFEHPVTERTINATLTAAVGLARQGVAFTTICVGDDATAPDFARTLTRAISGRLITMPLDHLGAFVVRDIASGQHRVIR